MSKKRPHQNDHIQKRKHAMLLERIADAKRRGKDYEFVGAKEISLFVHETEAKARSINRNKDLPIERNTGKLVMSLKAYEWDRIERMRSAILREDHRARLRRMHAANPNSIGPASR